MPEFCKRNFDNERKLANIKNSLLFSPDYAQYFVYLDKLARFRDLLKKQNALKKREKTFIFELEGHMKNEALDFDSATHEKLSQIRILNINKLEDPVFLEEFLSDKKHITDRIDADEERVYTCGKCVRVRSVSEFPEHIFWRLSILMQRKCTERFDWYLKLLLEFSGTHMPFLNYFIRYFNS